MAAEEGADALICAPPVAEEEGNVEEEFSVEEMREKDVARRESGISHGARAAAPLRRCLALHLALTQLALLAEALFALFEIAWRAITALEPSVSRAQSVRIARKLLVALPSSKGTSSLAWILETSSPLDRLFFLRIAAARCS